MWIRCNGEGDTIPTSSGEYFSIIIPINITDEKAEVTVYTQTEAGSSYWGYIWRSVYIEDVDGEYQFVKSMVLDHNLDVLSHWVNPEEGLSNNIPEQLVQLSNEIVGNETDDYQKLFLLNKWVAENIYYDWDYYTGGAARPSSSSDSVYEQKRAVCAGYANLLQDLVQAQNIPCIQVSTYSAGASTKGYFDETNYNITRSNHAHVEAYVNDRWVAMDPTWDSKNKYENGEYHYKTPNFLYFDVTVDYLAYSHKLINR